MPWPFAYGPWLLANAFEAAEEIEKATGVSIRLVNLPWLNRVDPAWLRHVIGTRRAVITMDNHYVHGGQGEMVAAAIAALGLEPAARVTRIGVTELPECGTNDEVLAYHGLDVAGLVALRDVTPRPAEAGAGEARCRCAAHAPGPSVRPRLADATMTILFWDIDGTLLTTGKAGVPAWEAAVKAVTGRDFQLSSIRVPGLTDFQIAVRTFEILGVEATDETLRRMVRLYEEGLPAALPLKHGRVLPNVREILEHLHGLDDVRSYLLTGNTRGGAKAKLTHYDLFKYFPDGAFAEDTGERATIAARALELARRAGPVAVDRVFVIGDTPHDVDCATSIGAKTIAVATGGYTLDELAAHRPWRVLQELPNAGEFLELIGIRDPGSGIRTIRRSETGPRSPVPDPDGITA